MRIATKMLYETSTIQINTNLSNLTQCDEMAATGLKINDVSDDPVGFSQVLNANTAISQLEQVQVNSITGTHWLANTETTLTSVSTAILDARDLCLQLANSYIDDEERTVAASQVNDMILNIAALANSQIDNGYLFSGTATNEMPFVFDDDVWPTSVDYQGNAIPFKLDTGSPSYTDVSIPGSQVYYASSILVDDTNNRIDFQENLNTGQLTGIIPSGEYSCEELADAIEIAMEDASSASNRITGITNSTGVSTSVSISNYDSLTLPSTSSVQLNWDGTGWVLADDGGYSSAILMSEGDENQVSIDLNQDGFGDIFVAMDSPMPVGSITFDVKTQPPADYEVSYDAATESYTILDMGGTLTNLSLLWKTGTGSGQSIAGDIGFTTDLTGASTYTGDPDVTWGLFETMIDLRDALYDDDTDGIDRAITRLNNHFEQTNTFIALAGIRAGHLETRNNVIDTMLINLEAEKGKTEDADMVAVLSDLSSKQVAYEAALSAYTKMISISILDFL